MKIVLYESASRGGNFEYSRCLFEAYSRHTGVTGVTWIIPSCADGPQTPAIRKVLCNDRRGFGLSILSRLHFLYRSLVNPLILLGHLSSRKERTYVILNDFEQLTAFFWVPLYKLFIRRHHFSVVLHDPDRDAYPPSKGISEFSMRSMMSLMSLGLYHEHLPDKPYYRNSNTRYLSVPHGQYKIRHTDPAMSGLLESARGNDHLVSIVGNIRMEKNYEISIKALSRIHGVKLVIAGAISSSSVSRSGLEKLAEDVGVTDRIVFIFKYLTEEEMSSVIGASSVILLNYKRSFTSQSGIFNMIAPFKKNIVLSDIQSGLAKIASRFGLGRFVDPDSIDDLVKELPKALGDEDRVKYSWDRYLQYASWENHVNIVVQALSPSHDRS